MQSSELELFPDDQDSREAASILARLDKVARESVRSFSSGGLVISYSGGVDSSILAELAFQTENGSGSTLLSLGASGSRDINELTRGPDIQQAKLPHVIREVESERVEKTALKVTAMVQVASLSHLEDCIAFYLIGEEAEKLGKIDIIASANGPDELYCGYDRFRRILDGEGYESVSEEINRALQAANELRSQVKAVLGKFGLKPAEPFLSEEFVEFALTVPLRLKIARGNDMLRKRVWRAYGRSLGLPDRVVMKEKKAMQYSMGIHKIVSGMLRRGKLQYDFSDHVVSASPKA